MRPTVSVTVCCYNSSRYLEGTLRSVCLQSYHDWELVIVNDGSTDDTESIVDKFVQEGWPVVYRAQSNAGLGRTRNRTIELARGDYLAILDHDDVWHPKKLAMQMAVARAKPEAAVVYSNCDLIDAEGAVLHRGLQQSQGGFRNGNVFDALLRKEFFPCWPTVVLRKRDVERCGGFADEYQYAEDLDLLLKMAFTGSFEYCRETLASYRMHPTQLGRRYDAWLADWLAINRYWAAQPAFQSPKQQRLLRRLLALDHLRTGLIGYGRSDDNRRVREYLRRSLTDAFSPKALTYWLLTFTRRSPAAPRS